MSKPNITIEDIYQTLRSLKPHIDDEFRVSDDPDDDTPGMQVTFGADETGWSYQTGDTSFSGGAYHYRHWGVCYLYRNSNCRELARQAYEEIREAMTEV